MVNKDKLRSDDSCLPDEGIVYESPMIEIIEMEMEGVIAISGNDYGNGGSYGM